MDYHYTMPNDHDASFATSEHQYDLKPRQREMLAFVTAKGFATVEELAQFFAVSTQTIRRDIRLLSQLQLMQRFHGGAGRSNDAIRLGYARKSASNIEIKQRIGEAVAADIPEGASVFLDVGTTVEVVAKALAGKGDIRVITHSLPAAMHLVGIEGVDLFVAGGTSRHADGSLVGGVTMQALEQFRVDYGVLGMSGFDEDGTPMDFDLEKVDLKRTIIQNADTVIVAVESSKFGHKGTTRVAPAGSMSAVYTESPPHEELAVVWRKENVRIKICQ